VLGDSLATLIYALANAYSDTAAVPLDRVVAHLRAENIAIQAGPLAEAVGPMQAIYFRDPDGDLVEVAEYVGETTAVSE